jgi:2-polyprenyl-6-hydroxyphenyl methylase / 3-demethylubiquinone-9 3-methyltransferase
VVNDYDRLQMDSKRKIYPENHWLRSRDPERALSAYLEQQDKAYSRVKNEFIRELMGDVKDKLVLDYGCGGGLFTIHAALNGAAKVVGVDAEETALSTARLFARAKGVERICSFVQSEEFPRFPCNIPFDVVLMKDVIEHVPDDQGLLHAAAEAIVPGGKLILSTQNALSLNYLLQGGYHKAWLKERDWCGWDPTHLRFYTSMSLSRKLKSAGFKTKAWRSVYIIPYKLPGLPGSDKQFTRVDSLSWVDVKLGGVFPYNRLGWNIIVLAEASPLVTKHIPVSAAVAGTAAAQPVLLTRESLRINQ